MYRATLTKNMPMKRAASDQASHEVARVLIALAPCSGAWFPRSRRHTTVLPSPKRYGKRYEDEMPVVKTDLFASAHEGSRVLPDGVLGEEDQGFAPWSCSFQVSWVVPSEEVSLASRLWLLL
jgi:hypothetical protein